MRKVGFLFGAVLGFLCIADAQILLQPTLAPTLEGGHAVRFTIPFKTSPAGSSPVVECTVTADLIGDAVSEQRISIPVNVPFGAEEIKQIIVVFPLNAVTARRVTSIEANVFCTAADGAESPRSAFSARVSVLIPDVPQIKPFPPTEFGVFVAGV